MKKILPVFILVLLLAVISFITKPTSKDFDDYITGRSYQKIYADDTIYQHYNQYVLKKINESKKYQDNILWSEVSIKPKGVSNPQTNELIEEEFRYIGIFGTWFAKSDIFDFQHK